MTFELELEPIESANFCASRDTIRNTEYIGREKRIKHRRLTADRRKTIRFDKTKTDRRVNQDRRINKTNRK
jgi:hypothetical protein